MTQISTPQEKFRAYAPPGMFVDRSRVSKKDELSSQQLTIPRGETVQIVSDDGDLLHHAYLESNRFSFGSGDQEPGTQL